MDRSGDTRGDSAKHRRDASGTRSTGKAGGTASVDIPPREKPLGVFTPTLDAAWEHRWHLLVLFFVALGIMARLVRFGLGFPLWGDESMLAANFLERGYAELLQPLDDGQMAPFGYLFAQRAVIDALGFNEWTLRLVTLVASIVSLPLFAHVAGRLFRGLPWVLAVAIFSVAYYPIRHAVEVKPYATDTFWAVLLVGLAVEWWRRPSRVGWLWAMAVLAPLAVLCSLPIVLVAGGISIGLLITVVKQRRIGAWMAFVAFNVALAGTFGWYVWFISTTQPANAQNMLVHWAAGFPPAVWSAVPLWLLDMFTGEMFAYPLGSDRGGSVLTTICLLIALVVLCRRGRGAIAGMAVGTLALTLVAAVLHRYPCGSERLSQYLAPLVCLLTGFGAACVVSWIRWQTVQQRAAVVYLWALVLICIGLMGRDIAHPYKFPWDRTHQGFARWFWTQGIDTPDLLCVETDLHQPLATLCPQYRCSQAIYSSRHAIDTARQVTDPLEEIRPLQCVGYWCDYDLPGQQRLKQWRTRMEEVYELTEVDSHHVMLGNELNIPWGIHYEVYHFEPKQRSTSELAERDLPGLPRR